MTDPPRRRRRSLYEPPRRRRRMAPLFALPLLPLVLLLSVGALASRFPAATLPDSSRSFPADSFVYDRAGHVIAELHRPGETRIPVPLTAISPDELRAIVAVEDRNFWQEGAIDWGRLAQAAVYDVSHHADAQGASTITEQLARLLYLNNQKTFERKLRELIIAHAMDSRLSKSEILDQYLNDVYFGHGATGIEAASRVYFGVSASQLDLAQASLLAGLPNAPSVLDPIQNPDGARGRQRVVLDAMVRNRAVSAAEADAAFQEKLQFGNGRGDDLNLYPQFTARVAQEVSAQLGQDPASAGLSIKTTLDAGLQQAAERAVQSRVAALSRLHVSDGAAVSLDPRTGDVLAYVGNAGAGHPGSNLDMAAQARQPGSTMKVVTYGAAIADRKVTMLTPVSDGPLTLPTGGGADGHQPWTVHDYDNGSHGTVPVAVALGNSLNIPAVRVEQQVGVAAVVQLARKLGITTLSNDPSSYGPSLTLGSYPVPLWQLAQAYGAVAGGGVLHPTRFLLSVTDASGREMLPAAGPGTSVLDPGAAFVMNQMLSDDSNRALVFGRGSALVIAGHRVAAKTGTTSDNKDALTVGWTPRVVTAAWVGNADNSAMDGVAGAMGAAPIWHSVMAAALGSGGDGWAAPPGNVHQLSWNGLQGWFLDGTSPGGPSLGADSTSGRSGCVSFPFLGQRPRFCASPTTP
ncbi:transglycosylase domain-containing protein [Candidatus Nephthysia bennettiae]|uniref:Transglycosylase domain-containing protein n=1 Tax=Candidatus Nephthysia bennettiae TaxID=3127016 RepID=A0A934K422_9BACT|nr:transglycosylase domain-containing protein [Candidatus Dormibacteraeota bacterium]MBJ7614297.1 transglycosylase domain-containing protein [Candidatus Dormibacteraeota bacterium]